MRNPARGGAPSCPVGKTDTGDFTRDICAFQAAGRAIGNALAADTRPEARDLSSVLRYRLTDCDLVYLGAATTWAMRPRTALRLADATRHDAIVTMHIPADRIGATSELETERQWRRWQEHCADRVRRIRR